MFWTASVSSYVRVIYPPTLKPHPNRNRHNEEKKKAPAPASDWLSQQTEASVLAYSVVGPSHAKE